MWNGNCDHDFHHLQDLHHDNVSEILQSEMALDLTKKMLGKGLLDAKQTTGTCYCSQQALEYELPPPQLIKMNQTTGPSYSPSNHHPVEILAGFLYKVTHSSKSCRIMCRMSTQLSSTCFCGKLFEKAMKCPCQTCACCKSMHSKKKTQKLS